MHDLKSIREAAAEFDRGLARRGLQPQSASILALDADRRAAQTELQEIQTKRNELSRGIGQAKSRGEPVEAIMAEVAAMKERMAALEAIMPTLLSFWAWRSCCRSASSSAVGFNVSCSVMKPPPMPVIVRW